MAWYAFGKFCCACTSPSDGRDLSEQTGHVEQIPAVMQRKCRIEHFAPPVEAGPIVHDATIPQNNACDDTVCPPESTDRSSQAPTSIPASVDFEIEVEKTAEQSKIGLEIHRNLTSMVKILRVKEGMIAEYNKAAALEGKMEVKAGYHIVEINGVSGSRDAVMHAVGQSERLRIKLRTFEGDLEAEAARCTEFGI
mmetsp:Transcript_23270/g.51385  ORF Transcript_23270/g.51385 Transcript_23270/m.51385 type:complete len:195 (+) Transcript_23270:76-660(+)